MKTDNNIMGTKEETTPAEFTLVVDPGTKVFQTQVEGNLKNVCEPVADVECSTSATPETLAWKQESKQNNKDFSSSGKNETRINRLTGRAVSTRFYVLAANTGLRHTETETGKYECVKTATQPAVLAPKF